MKKNEKLAITLVMALSVLPISCSKKFEESLSSAKKLSEAMLDKEQYQELLGGIVQTGSNLAHIKVEQDGLVVNMEDGQKFLAKELEKAFPYGYFTKLNTLTMEKSLTKEEITEIWKFYNTSAGKKWLKLNPEIIDETMMAVRSDLDERLDTLIDTMIKRHKIEIKDKRKG